MVEEFTIKSSRSAAALKFSEPKPPRLSRAVESCRVTLKAPDIATSSARIFEPAGVLWLFEAMVADDQGWEGEKRWSSLDGDFAFSCAYGEQGVVAMTVTLWGPYHEDEWRAQAVIHVEASRMGELAAKLRQFFMRLSRAS